MKGGHGAGGPEPGVDGDLLLLPVAQAAVVRDADVLLQLRDLRAAEQTRGVRPGRATPAQKSRDYLTRAKYTLSSRVTYDWTHTCWTGI